MRITPFLLLVVVAGCKTGTGVNTRIAPVAALPGAAAAYQASALGTGAAPGTIAGRVGRFDGAAFQPAAGVAVTLDDGAATATTDAGGYYGFANVAAGVHGVKADDAAAHPAALAFRVGGLSGLARANLALVPRERPAGLAADAIAVAGVAVDPRGGALPGATVRCTESLTADGNHTATADADGFYAVVLAGAARGALTDGTGSLTAFGTTPGGVRVESTDVLALALGPAATVPVTAATKAFAAPSELRWVSADGGRRVLGGKGIPTRRDELVVRFTGPQGYSEASPVGFEDGNAVLVPPVASGVTVELLPLGLLPPDGKAPGIPL